MPLDVKKAATSADTAETAGGWRARTSKLEIFRDFAHYGLSWPTDNEKIVHLSVYVATTHRERGCGGEPG